MLKVCRFFLAFHCRSWRYRVIFRLRWRELIALGRRGAGGGVRFALMDSWRGRMTDKPCLDTVNRPNQPAWHQDDFAQIRFSAEDLDQGSKRIGQAI